MKHLLPFLLLTLPVLGQREAAPAQKQEAVRKFAVLDVPCYPVIRSPHEISIDGSLAEWPKEVPALLIDDPRQLSGTAHQSWRGQSDLAARGALLWDEERLYLSFFIRDDWPRALPKETPLAAPLFPPCDQFELFFDPKRDTRAAGSDPGRREDHQYVMGLQANRRSFSIAWRRRNGSPEPKSGFRGVMLYDVRQKAWVVEASVPWSELLGSGTTPKQGLAIDANFIFSDYDAPSDDLAQTRIGWTFGSHPQSIDPAMYGTLILHGDSYTENHPPKRPRLPKTSGIGQPRNKTLHMWIDQLRQLPVKPGMAGLIGDRGAVLNQLDAVLEEYPLADTQQLILLMQRRMQRELAGYLERGAPQALLYATLEMLKSIPEKYEGDEITIRALPGRGFLVRSKEGMVQIGPGLVLGERLAGALDALCLSHAFDPMDRNDPLALRVFARKRSVLVHTGFHLHGYGLFHEHAVAPGQEGKLPGGIRVRPLGTIGEKNSVTPTVGWQLSFPNGHIVVDAALSGLPSQLKLPQGKKHIDVLILDPIHPAWEQWIKEAKPRDVLLSGFLDLPRFRNGALYRNNRLADARDFVRKLEAQGVRAWLLSPGRAWRQNR
ncbi:MAG: hypothetical protein CSA62_12845 [Planctomycetota bacterium]|nr:MAG: hypothetical protein CSA62_12845 [Planctomycetota bacterium]